jgi:hypothetical protein
LAAISLRSLRLCGEALAFVLVDQTPNSVLQDSNIKVNQQANLAA